MFELGQILELTTEKIVGEGEAIAFVDNFTIFVPMAAPDERLRVKITEVKKNYAKAQIVEILEKGKNRVEAICPLYGKCGGCNMMHLSYPCQIESKKDNIVGLIKKLGNNIDYPINVHSASPFHYRNRAQFHKTKDCLPSYASLYSNELIPVENCPILVPELSNWLSTKPKLNKDRQNTFGFNGKVYTEEKDTIASVNILGKDFTFDISGFFQSNIEMLEKLIPFAIEGTGGKLAADLYCGTGLFASFLSQSFENLICVEQDNRSLSHASRNVNANGKKGTSFTLSSIEDWTKSPKAKSNFDYVLVDPPRTGLSNTVKNWITQNKVALLGYVSCNPLTLARDLTNLTKSGYNVESLELFDFYPETSHMEAYVRFAKD